MSNLALSALRALSPLRVPALAGALVLAACGDDAAERDMSDATASDATASDGSTPDAMRDASAQPTDGRTSDQADAQPAFDGDVPDAQPAVDAADADAPATAPDATTQVGAMATVTPPTAAFTLAYAAGSLPFWTEAQSSASAGSAAIAEVTYDFGDGSALTTEPSHRYQAAGTFTVTQTVRAADGSSATSTQQVTVTAFTPVRFSQTDRSANMRTPDGYLVENRHGLCGIRTDDAIQPGAGVFYFEGTLLSSRVGGFGVNTADAPLDVGAGGNASSLGYEAAGPVRATGSSCTGVGSIDNLVPTVGFVIDYRAASPRVHLLQRSAGAVGVRASCSMGISAPLYATYWSERNNVGYEGLLNTGADVVNTPFVLTADEVRAALSAVGEVEAAGAIVFGFGASRAGRPNSLPQIEVPGALEVAYGQPVTLTGSATDAEDGVLSASIVWTDISSLWHARVTGTGPSFTFTPSSGGRHPVEATVTDLDGGKSTKTVMVTVTGPALASSVQLVPDATTGQGITVSPDGLAAHFAGPGKDGIKANQGLYGDFWYFEVQRLNPIRNMGNGLVVQEGSLNPYDYVDVPWSVSINVFNGVWRELMSHDVYVPEASDTTYGWAVDYREEHPKVYLIVRGDLLTTFDLQEVWTPLFPMVYGNIAEPQPSVGWDQSVNFGTAPFVFDARSILAAKNIDASGLKLGWGVHAQ